MERERGGGGWGETEWERELIYFKVKGKITRGVTFFDYLYMLTHSHNSYLTLYGVAFRADAKVYSVYHEHLSDM